MDGAGDDAKALAARAGSEAARMLAATERHAPESMIQLRTDQFRVIATLLARTALATETGCGTSGCMGAPIDGIRFWVPQDRLRAAEARIAQLGERDAMERLRL